MLCSKPLCYLLNLYATYAMLCYAILCYVHVGYGGTQTVTPVDSHRGLVLVSRIEV
jgi:hypothetical protein